MQFITCILTFFLYIFIIEKECEDIFPDSDSENSSEEEKVLNELLV